MPATAACAGGAVEIVARLNFSYATTVRGFPHGLVGGEELLHQLRGFGSWNIATQPLCFAADFA